MRNEGRSLVGQAYEHLSIDPIPAKLKACLTIGGIAILMVGCTTLPAPTPVSEATPPAVVLPDYVYAPLQEAAPLLLIGERDASIASDLPLLAELWASDGRIVDAKGTADPSDDYIWQGRDAVLDRYDLAVFPVPPPPLTELSGVVVTDEGEWVRIDNGHDRWIIVMEDGRWRLLELTYSLP